MKTEKMKKWKLIKGYWPRCYGAGWLPALKLLGFTEEEINKIEREQQEELNAIKYLEKEYYNSHRPETRKVVWEFKQQDKFEEKRTRSRKDKIEKYKEKLQNIKTSHQSWRKQGIPYWLRELMLEMCGYEELKGKIDQLEKCYREGEGNNDVQISEREIDLAREVDIVKLVGVNARGRRPIMTNCPFHRDNQPSFAIYKDHAHCFGCNWHGNAIDFLIERDDLDFPSAVKLLNKYK